MTSVTSFIVFILAVVIGFICMNKQMTLNKNRPFKNTKGIIYMYLYKTLFFGGTLTLLYPIINFNKYIIAILIGCFGLANIYHIILLVFAIRGDIRSIMVNR